MNIHVMSLGSPGTLAKARRLQLADASFRDLHIYRKIDQNCTSSV